MVTTKAPGQLQMFCVAIEKLRDYFDQCSKCYTIIRFFAYVYCQVVEVKAEAQTDETEAKAKTQTKHSHTDTDPKK